jgi:hypothetical protein
MTEDEDGFDGGPGGFDVDDWARLKPFVGALATLEDVQRRAAIFALADTQGGRVLDMPLPQPVIWWSDDGEQAAVAVQAEAHETDDETMEVLGLILPDGAGAVALLEDVDLVDDSDPVWRRLVTEAVGDETGEDDQD